MSNSHLRYLIHESESPESVFYTIGPYYDLPLLLKDLRILMKENPSTHYRVVIEKVEIIDSFQLKRT